MPEKDVTVTAEVDDKPALESSASRRTRKKSFPS
jgi:hypothetical protein